MTNDLSQTPKVKYPNLSSALRLNDPSDSEHKIQNDAASSCDPIVDHLMGSRAFKCVVWFFFAALLGVGLTVVVMNMEFARYGFYNDYRVGILLYGGMPAIVSIVPFITMVVLPFSRRLK